MLTRVAALFIDWIVRGPWRDPMSFGFPLTKMYEDAALISRIELPGIGYLGQLHWGLWALYCWPCVHGLCLPACWLVFRSR